MMPLPPVSLLRRFKRICLGVSVVMALVTPCSQAFADDDFLSMSLEELMSMEVTSVSRQATQLAHSAAAIFVISNDDIRRSGARNIAEALAIAPGMQVAQIDASRWALSARGFNSRYANSLLVMIDGRSIYNNTFSGVYWESHDAVLEDIDRIEVIRGPGAALWGANAVNGVINIITKKASETQGHYLLVSAGDNEDYSAAWRMGGILNSNSNYRVYGKYRNHGEYKYIAGDYPNAVEPVQEGSAHDDWDMEQLGFRIESLLDNGAELTLQGDFYDGNNGQRRLDYIPSSPTFGSLVDNHTDFEGFNVLSKYARNNQDGSSYIVQFYFDKADRKEDFNDERWSIYDIDAQYTFSKWDNHSVISGFNYRYKDHETRPTPHLIFFPQSADYEDLSFFINDEISVWDDRLKITIGAKFEHHSWSDKEVEIQPNIRFAYLYSKKDTFWGSIAKAVRTPSRVEQEARLHVVTLPAGEFQGVPPFLGPIIAMTQPEGNMKSEELIAYEIGWRSAIADNLYVDIAVFYNNYEDYRSVNFSGLPVVAPGFLMALTSFANENEIESKGFEAVVDWRVSADWDIKFNYSFIDQDSLPSTGTSVDIQSFPAEHIVNLRSSNRLAENVSLDTWVRYVDELGDFGIDSYTTLDVRLSWRITKNLELSLVGKNLTDSRHQEFISEVVRSPDVEIERTISATVELTF
jgi:iron complex outermembrane receptor protein